MLKLSVEFKTPERNRHSEWCDESTYIREPPFFTDFPLEKPGVSDIEDARCLLTLGDTVTTDHISPAGPFGSKNRCRAPRGERSVGCRLVRTSRQR